MSLPGDLSATQITGTYLDCAGAARQGRITFTPSATLTDATGDVVIPAIARVYVLSAQGSFRTDPLVCTDSATISPEGWAYRIVLSLDDLPASQWDILLPYSPSPVDISTITPVVPQAAVTSYVPQSGGNMTGKLTLTGTVPLQIPGGAASGDVLTSDSSGNAAWGTLAAAGGVSAAALAAETTRAEAAEAGLLPLAGGTMTGNIAMGGTHKVTGVAAGSSSGDAVAFQQLPASLPPSGTAGGVLTGTYPNPGIGTLNQSTTGTAAGLSSTLAIGSGGTGATSGPAALTALGADARYPQRAAGTSAVAGPLQYYNPEDDGAVFDGSTDDSSHLLATLARGSTIQFPPGTTVVNAAQLTFQSSNLHIRGSGMYDTIVKCTSSGLSSLWVYGSSFVSTVELSDMTLDGTGVSISAVATLGNRLDRLRIRRVRFVNWPSVIIQSGYAAETIVEDCEADGAGSGTGTFFLSTNRENESISLRRNRLRWLNTGITIGSGNPTGVQYHSAYIDISDNYIDLGWWLLKAVTSGSGGTVTYTSSTVTDSGASFGTVAAGTTVRVLTPLQTGTLTTIGTQLTDASANFTGNSVWRGHIVRSGTAFAVVSKVETATQLHVEEWLSQTTYQPVPPPSSASYTIYGVTLGATVSNTSTAITIAHGGGGNGGGWYDLQGNSVTPSSGTLYEVLPAHPVYPVFCNVPTEKIKIHGNTIRRGWADGIEFFGSRGIITGNIVEDGQDEGIVCEGFSAANPGVKNIVSGNICRHNGTSGLNLQYQADLEAGPNQLEDNTWGAPSSLNLPQLLAYNLVNSTITGGRATNSGESAINQAGMTIDGASTSGLKVIGWSGHGAAVADIRITSAVTAGTCDLLDVDGVIGYQGTANGQRLRVKGTGTPSLIASPGSQFLSTSGSGPGTALYVKEAASDSTGWDVMGAAVTPSVQWVTATGSYTWTKPAGAQIVDIILCAGGAGGASGAVEISGNAGGGGGGGGGGILMRTFAAADLGSSITGTVGAGGNGGTAASGTTATSGNNGSAGGTTTFGSAAAVSGGNASAGGTTAGGNGGTAGTGNGASGAGGAGGAAANGTASAAAAGAAGGGGGGGANTGSVFNGGIGQFSLMGATTNTGTAGVAGGASPGTGTQPAIKGTASCGGGGGGGANGASPTAQTGATAFYGGGGGGGGGAFIASGTGTSGAGGKGGDGFALIVTHFT